MYAKLGRLCFQHRRAVLIGWVILFVVGIGIGGGVFGKLKDSNGGSSAESVQGFNIVDKEIWLTGLFSTSGAATFERRTNASSR